MEPSQLQDEERSRFSFRSRRDREEDCAALDAADELRSTIQWEARQHIPFDSNDVNLDYQVMEAGTGTGDQGQLDVLLVAAKKDKVQDYTAVVSQAGCVPVVLGVDAFALQNAYELSAGVQAKRG